MMSVITFINVTLLLWIYVVYLSVGLILAVRILGEDFTTHTWSLHGIKRSFKNEPWVATLTAVLAILLPVFFLYLWISYRRDVARQKRRG